MSMETLVDAIEGYLGIESQCEREVNAGRALDEVTVKQMREARQRVERAVQEARGATGAMSAGEGRRIFDRILVAVDRSAQASWAATLAASMAAPTTGRLLLAHVCDMSPPVFGNDVVYEADLELPCPQEDGEKFLGDMQRRLAAGVAIETRLLRGEAIEEIARAAEEWKADLVVMGAHARGRLATFMLGSTAEGVIQKVKCPVLVVAHEYPAATAAVAATAAHSVEAAEPAVRHWLFG